MPRIDPCSFARALLSYRRCAAEALTHLCLGNDETAKVAMEAGALEMLRDLVGDEGSGAAAGPVVRTT